MMRRVGVLLVATVVLGGCGEGGASGDGWAGTVDTLASGVVVISNPDAEAMEGLESFRAQGPYDIFDPDGRFLGTLRTDLDPYPRPRVLDGRIVGVERDELGVPYVVVYEIAGR